MPRITQSNVRQHLFDAAKTYARLTGEQVGIILSNKGNISVIGKEALKDFVNAHRGDIVRTLMRSTSTQLDPFCEISPVHDEVPRTLDEADLSSHTRERLRNLLTSAIRKSTGNFSL